jgi:hypothetical protein
MFYSAETLGPKQSLLPSGTLLCRDAPIARIGTQRYHVTELPAAADSATADENGMVEVDRPPSEVFSRQSMASFEAAPVTLGHPGEMVGPDNWADLAVGHVMNVRRDGDLLVGDLLIPDQRGIQAVRSLGWRALSAGYDARYQPTGDGRRTPAANRCRRQPPGAIATRSGGPLRTCLFDWRPRPPTSCTPGPDANARRVGR